MRGIHIGGQLIFPERMVRPVAFDPINDQLLLLDFTANNTELTASIVEDIYLFSDYVNQKLGEAGALYGIGGYGEHRTVYSRSRVFDSPTPGEEPRRLHLGVDIWGKAGTPVLTPLDGKVHSVAFNDHYGDYGATIILEHAISGIRFHSLYGHLALQDIEALEEGDEIKAGALLAHFGEPEENGHWPPHLHFQLIIEMGKNKGDYPGVCRYSERDQYLTNCPDPDMILDMLRYAVKKEQE